MTPLMKHSEPFSGLTGKGVRVAVIDSGVHAAHPHIAGVAGGITIGPGADDELAYTDVIGHGTAVMAAIKEKAPEAEYFAVRVFYSSLRTSIDLLVRAIEWSIAHRMHVVNLSLGTTNPAHQSRLVPVIARAREAGVILVSAQDVDGTPSLPGSLPGVIGIELNWDCPRETYSARSSPEGLILTASGFPRSLPGVPPVKNLHGISFAVANATGFVVRACERLGARSYEHVCQALSEAVQEQSREAATGETL
jgi:subtilisin family serine protease